MNRYWQALDSCARHAQRKVSTCPLVAHSHFLKCLNLTWIQWDMVRLVPVFPVYCSQWFLFSYCWTSWKSRDKEEQKWNKDEDGRNQEMWVQREVCVLWDTKKRSWLRWRKTCGDTESCYGVQPESKLWRRDSKGCSVKGHLVRPLAPASPVSPNIPAR